MPKIGPQIYEKNAKHQAGVLHFFRSNVQRPTSNVDNRNFFKANSQSYKIAFTSAATVAPLKPNFSSSTLYGAE